MQVRFFGQIFIYPVCKNQNDFMLHMVVYVCIRFCCWWAVILIKRGEKNGIKNIKFPKSKKNFSDASASSVN